MSRPFPPITEILPHRGTMLLIDAVIDYSPTEITCTYCPQADSWYGQDGLPTWFGIELMAQAIAAHVALTAVARGKKPKLGALLGSRNYRSRIAEFPANVPLVVMTLLEFQDDSGLGAYECRILQNNQEIANATLKVYEPESFKQFLSTGIATP